MTQVMAGDRFNWKGEFDRLDSISRERALTSAESCLLERIITHLDGKVKRKRRWGMLR